MVLAHMVRHILLGTVAPALAWLIASRFPQPRWLAHRTALGTLAAHPATAWLAATVTVIGWHVPAVFDLAQRSALWHGVQDASAIWVVDTLEHQPRAALEVESRDGIRTVLELSWPEEYALPPGKSTESRK